MAALACQIIGRNILAVQLIAQLHTHRRLLRRRTLIVDIVAICLPRQLVAGLRIGLIALNIRNITEIRRICQRLRTVRVLQPVAHKRLLRIATGIRKDIDRLLLA